MTLSNHSTIHLPSQRESPSFMKKWTKKKPAPNDLHPWLLSDIEPLPWLPPCPNQVRPSPSLSTLYRPALKKGRQQSISATPSPLSSSINTVSTLSSGISIPSSPSLSPSKTQGKRRPSDDGISKLANDSRLHAPAVFSPTPSRPRIATPSTSSSLSSSADATRALMLLPSRDTNDTIRSQTETQPQSPPAKSHRYDAQEWPCVLSQDDDEQDRTVAQHYILRTAFEGDFSAPVRQALDKGCVVLDVGCGPGTWTMEMSTEFPNSTFIGIDHQSFFPREIKPKNCLFRSCDVTQLPLPFPDNSIDYIFQRDLNWGLLAHMWSPLVKEYLRILKPGGWLELMEADLETQSSQKNECVMNDKLLYGLTLRQQDPYVARRLSSILAINGFRRVQSCFQSLPLGWGTSHAPAGSTAKCSAFASGVASQHLFLLRSLQHWLSSVAGMNGEKYNAFISNLPNEWKSAETYMNWHCAMAQKPQK